MAKNKELQTIVSFAGKVDPSLTSAALKAGKQMQQMQQKVKKMGKKVVKGFGKAVKGVGMGMIATATAAAVALGGMAKQGISLASDLEEVQNVVQTTFKSGEGAINDFAKTALNKFGITELNAKQFSGTLGAMFKSMGVGDEQMLTMSKNLSALSGDMASFYNLDTTDAFQKIRSGISGETEPLKQLGINMSVANLEEFAKAQGESKKFADMSQAEQAMLRYGYLMEATADAQGDFNKTSDGYANQQRLMKENLKQLSARIMKGILPVLADGMKVINSFMDSFDTKPIEKIVEVFGDIFEQSLPFVEKLLPKVSELLESVAPLFGTLFESLQPIAETLFPIFKDLFDMCNPLLDDLAKALIPPLKKIIESLYNVLRPLVPSIIKLLTALVPLLNLIPPIIEAIGYISDLTSSPLGGLKAYSRYTENKKQKEDREKENAERQKQLGEASDAMTAYANGGFATHASIFGEAGLEAAIPIKPGNPRSLALLEKTAQLLGVRAMPTKLKPLSTSNSPTYVLEYKPQIYGNGADVEPVLQRGYSQVKQMFEEFIDERERVCFE